MSTKAAPFPMTVALAIALAWGCVGAVALYATLRLCQVLLTNEPFPTTELLSGSIAYLWRVATAVFGGALFAFAAFVIARDDCESAARRLPHALVFVGCYLALQSLIAP